MIRVISSFYGLPVHFTKTILLGGTGKTTEHWGKWWHPFVEWTAQQHSGQKNKSCCTYLTTSSCSVCRRHCGLREQRAERLHQDDNEWWWGERHVPNQNRPPGPGAHRPQSRESRTMAGAAGARRSAQLAQASVVLQLQQLGSAPNKL